MDRDLIIGNALEKFETDDISDKIPESLPLVSEFCEKYIGSKAFANMDILFIQHHLGPFIPRIHAMFDHGLQASKCWFVDVPYSTNESVRKELGKIGCLSSHMVRPFNNPIAPYSRRQLERVEYVISKLADHDCSRLLVVDDGAYFIRTLSHLICRDRKLVNKFKQRPTYLVEQTTRGHRYLETEQAKQMLDLLSIPMVSIARAHTKYDLESPFIGASVSQGMVNALKKIGRLTSGLGRVLVIGFGAVGRATTYALSKLDLASAIDVYDIKWKTLGKEIKSARANVLTDLPRKGDYDTVLGCTGKAAIHSRKQLEILADNAVLVSGSSAAIEFNREKFIDLAYKDDKDDFFIVKPEETRNDGIHAAINMKLEEKVFTFVNAGFPINFDERIKHERTECIPALLIQPTHGMLVAAANETLKKSPGFHTLSRRADDWFYKHGLKWVERYSGQSLS